MFIDTPTDSIFQIETNGNVISSFKHFSNTPTGLAFDGTYLWSSDNSTDQIYKIDVTTFQPLDSLIAPGGGAPSGLTFDGQYLWVSNNISDSIYQIDIEFIPTTSTTTSNLRELNIYPNPTSDQLTISSEQLVRSKIDIIDISGKTVKTFQQNTKFIDTSNLTNGIYFICCDVEKRRICKKFIKF